MKEGDVDSRLVAFKVAGDVKEDDVDPRLVAFEVAGADGEVAPGNVELSLDPVNHKDADVGSQRENKHRDSSLFHKFFLYRSHLTALMLTTLVKCKRRWTLSTGAVPEKCCK